jgi:membrane associated rhomboid family serine protease
VRAPPRQSDSAEDAEGSAISTAPTTGPDSPPGEPADVWRAQRTRRQQGVYGRGGGGGYRQVGFGFGPPVTPDVIKQLLIANAIVFVAQRLWVPINDLFAVEPRAVWTIGYFWQPFTYMWLHGSLGHLVMNLLSLWMFGSPLALAWGARRFLRFYLICGVGAGFIIATLPYLMYAIGLGGMGVATQTVGASGAIYGVLLAYSLTWPDRTIMLIFPPVAFRAIWLIPGLFILTLVMDPQGNVSHVGHLGGVVVGWLFLRRSGHAGTITLSQLKYRWRRYRMRQRLRAIREDEFESRRRRDNDRTLH